MNVRRCMALTLTIGLAVGLACGARVLRYGDLTAHDVTGRSLPARLTLIERADTAHAFYIAPAAAQASYPITASSLATSPDWTAEGNQAGALFGRSVGTAGDVNGDGYADLVVGAPGYDGGQVDEGRVFVYHGSSTGLTATPAWTAEGSQAGGRFGQSVGTAGDVNGDGYDDLVVAADRYDGKEVDAGRIYVYHGGSAGLAKTPAWTAEGDQKQAQFGHLVGTAGDVNGDGYADLVVGANKYDAGQADEGRAYVYHGASTGLAKTPAWTAEGNQANAFFGCRVGTAGDVNGDGYADVVIGAYGYDAGQTDEGRAYVYHGGSTGLAESPAWIAESNQPGASMGLSVGTAGDVNGDGYADVGVGARKYDDGEADEGRVYVYHGGSTGLAQTAAWTAESNRAGAWFGWSVGTAGDVNGDGYADLIAAANRYDGGEVREGRATVYLGGTTGLAETPAWTAEGDQGYAHFGQSVGTAGDVNGDGYADVVVGAYYYDAGSTNEGRAYVYYGQGALPRVGFSSKTYQADEGAGTVQISVTLDQPSTQTVQVDCETRDGTAHAPEDYASVSVRLTFPPGSTVQTLEVSIADDALDEGDEMVELTLANAIYAGLDGTRNPATLTIVDDDEVVPPLPKVGFGSPITQVGEGAGSVQISVTLDQPSTQTVQVDCETSDGTARAPDDYASVSVRLVFPPGSTVQTVEVSIVDDALDEEDETIELTLASASYAGLDGTRNPATLTIVDDDDDDDDEVLYLPVVICGP